MSFLGPTPEQLGIGSFSPGGVYDSTSPIGFDTPSTFDPTIQLVDPTNTGDTGAVQDISTPPFISQNNPETAGNSSLGAILNNAINTGFAAWQLASQPRGTPRTVTTTTGPGGASTTVVSGRSPGLVGSIFGPQTQQQNQTLTFIILIIAGLLIYKAIVK